MFQHPIFQSLNNDVIYHNYLAVFDAIDFFFQLPLQCGNNYFKLENWTCVLSFSWYCLLVFLSAITKWWSGGSSIAECLQFVCLFGVVILLLFFL